MRAYLNSPHRPEAQASGLDSDRAKKKTGSRPVAPARSRRVKTTPTKGGGRREPNGDPLTALQAHRAQKRKIENAARVAKGGKPSFIPLHRRILARTDLSYGARILFSYLQNTPSARKEGIAYPYQATLARALGVGRKQIQLYVKELVEAESPWVQ